MHSGHSCGAKSTVARDTGLITPGKKNIYNATQSQTFFMCRPILKKVAIYVCLYAQVLRAKT